MLSNLAQITVWPDQGVNGTRINVEIQTCNTVPRARLQVHVSNWIVKGIPHYRPRSEASEGYVFTGICLSNEVLYSGKQTDATAIDFQPIGISKLQWRLSVYYYGRAVRILLECILVWTNKFNLL